jgi:GDP/UDP-N,N'-diacetylbacillosamine 2-epimerase (hydrolysing)
VKKKILIVTERRADYSKFRPVIKEIEKSKNLDYYLIVTGSHLLKEYGHTINEIKNDGFKINSKFQMYEKNNNNSGADMASAIGKSIIFLSNKIQEIKPDIILSGFDIGSNLAVSIVGAHMNILVAHLEGGDVSGTIDESIRHAITKFAHIHFTTNSSASKRLVKMGENSKYVHTVGNSSLDGIKKIKLIPKKELEDEFGIDLTNPFVLIMQHTVTSEIDNVDKYMKNTIDAINELKIQAIIIHGNADAGSKNISKIIKNSKIKQYAALPFEKYINLLKCADALVGNSSSGIMEAPFLKIPSINIGTRQSGRLHSESVIDVGYSKNDIKNILQKIIFDDKFKKKMKFQKYLYGNGNSSLKIVNFLEKIDLKKINIQKHLTY